MDYKEYHVSKEGSDFNEGTASAPFLTIQKAADEARAGDKVIVHEGVYREWVKPRRSGLGDDCRITYEAAKGEHVVIKGSERITGWSHEKDNVWKVSIDNSFFNEFNPYTHLVDGDWIVDPRNYDVHVGEVYLNGKSFYEAVSIEEVYNPEKRTASPHETWGGRREEIPNPEDTLYQWYCTQEQQNTIIYANFQGINPNDEEVEINVRKACFFPEKTGLNYITVRGFEMMHAATSWAPPTSMQEGLICVNWSKGWVIENNIIHDSKCSGISIGKEGSTGDNDFTKYRRKPGYQYQMEAVFKARNIGWSKERIGSHVIRNNVIYNCGQNGIVGHLGCVFSDIYGNEIYNIAVKHEFYGHEIAGIKLHAAIDVQIHNNYIHDCTLGTWLDWQAQGVRVSSNIYNNNNRDLMVEVTHGPYLIDNNIFTSAYTFDNAAQGGAYVHNLCCGFTNSYPVLDRSTPYHLPHSTEVLGTVLVYGFDDRWYQNIFAGGKEADRAYGTALYNGAPISLEEYIERVRTLGNGDVEQFARVKQPAYINGNVYLNGAEAFDREKDYYKDDVKPEVKIVDEGKEVYLEITMPRGALEIPTEIVTTKTLGMVRIVEQRYENPDGSALSLNEDLTGEVRKDQPKAGPIESIHEGKNRIKIWSK
ncbi:MAG: right-handed parallel beta-helix repeat-containing protein [Clostridiales bacterium]|nr:right-handed parallel beta-helix repeat-containing protein [Clostridiales bacterium]